ncbi:MAG: hypothetical protein Q7T74_02045, partial [Candidatus Saccharibacteria bacterium]|nr:hypothetical protein [Candidatus Saccharibacteria bacterium]
SVGNVISEIKLEIDGVSYIGEAVAAEGPSVDFVFNLDGEVIANMHDEIDINVILELKEQYGNYLNSETIKASVLVDMTKAEGASNIALENINGSAIGKKLLLMAEGIIIPVDGFSFETETLSDNDTVGEFTLEFDVTAFENDFYIANIVNQVGVPSTHGVKYAVEGGSAIVTAVLSSTADDDLDTFVVHDGETETFTLTVIIDPHVAGQFRVTLSEVWFSNPNGERASELYNVTPATDFRTNYIAINN